MKTKNAALGILVISFLAVALVSADTDDYYGGMMSNNYGMMGNYCGMMYGSYGYGWMIFFWIISLLIIAVLVLLIILIVKQLQKK